MVTIGQSIFESEFLILYLWKQKVEYDRKKRMVQKKQENNKKIPLLLIKESGKIGNRLNMEE
ncbi:MAG: hypothetical protein BAA00_17740 [Parageobacillus thermoglucosidasius]|uniref:Uncharacterized protein n=1 Tax=Geobacillus sp. (strain Y4.1MC1) TaxID=581103 RepID=A0A7U3YIH5_GEOS0|nr:hypothetical protein [Parageobacillus thermoglucosidasius]OUM84243.1 MAG: hypothetical protein BAA00_17740 [Parageobacillus thermoglucosidasius]